MLRQQKGLSARYISLQIGKSENYLNKIENKKAYPSMSMLFDICDILEVTLEEFFNETIDNPERLREVVVGLKKLDESTLAHFDEIIKELNRRYD